MNLKEALLYDTLDNDRVRCNICQRRCIIEPGVIGYCSTRLNENGKLYTLIYGQVSTWKVAPAEIKPLFHFYPGGNFLSFGSLGCNFRCIGCQNWEIAHVMLEGISTKGKGGWYLPDTHALYIPPQQACELAKKHGCDGISWTYNEPTLWFEYTLDTAKLAKEEGLATNYVTNGFITTAALDMIGPYLDAFRVDIKGFDAEFYKKIANVSNFKGILEVTERAKHKWDMHIEVITNIIPGYNDDDEQLSNIAKWIYTSLGMDTPWHLTRFIPHLKLSDVRETPVLTLEKAREIGVKAGLKFVYLGNVPGHRWENTYCPKCNNLLIERDNYRILQYNLSNNKCKFCGEYIPIKSRDAD